MSEPKDRPAGRGVDLPLSGERAEALHAAIDAGVRQRAAEPPPLSLRRTAEVAAEFRALVQAIEQLKEKMERFGEVSTSRPGWPGALELRLKRALRKLVRRHLDQEKEVHLALEGVLQRLCDLLVAEHEIFDDNVGRLVQEKPRRADRDRDA